MDYMNCKLVVSHEFMHESWDSTNWLLMIALLVYELVLKRAVIVFSKMHLRTTVKASQTLDTYSFGKNEKYASIRISLLHSLPFKNCGIASLSKSSCVILPETSDPFFSKGGLWTRLSTVAVLFCWTLTHGDNSLIHDLNRHWRRNILKKVCSFRT